MSRTNRRLRGLVVAISAGLFSAGCATQTAQVPVSQLEAPAAPKRETLTPLTLSAVQVSLIKAGLKGKLRDLANVERLKAGQQSKSGAITVCGHAVSKAGKLPFTGNFLDVKSKIDPKHVTTTFVPLSIAQTEAERYSVTKVCLEDGLAL